MKIVIRPKQVAIVFAAIATGLILAGIAGVLSRFVLGHENVFGLVEMFDLDAEGNIPAYFSMILIFLCSMLLCFIGVSQKKRSKPYVLWLLLAAIFVFLSFDEIAQIHERIGLGMKSELHITGIFNKAWVMPYGMAVIVLFIGYFRFILESPPVIRRWIILAGVVYIGGVIGFELLAGLYVEQHGIRDMWHALLSVCEESLEMFVMVIFQYALLLYIETELKSPRIIISSLENGRSDTPAEKIAQTDDTSGLHRWKIHREGSSDHHGLIGCWSIILHCQKAVDLRVRYGLNYAVSPCNRECIHLHVFPKSEVHPVVAL